MSAIILDCETTGAKDPRLVEAAWVAFDLPADATYLIGHNIDFDYGVICTCGPQPAPKRICTLALSRALWPDTDSHSLTAMLYRVAPGAARTLCPRAHGAAIDVELCRILLNQIVEKAAPADWEALWQVSETARIPTRMYFGIHKDRPIAEVPADYKRWLLKQPTLDPYLRKALEV